MSVAQNTIQLNVRMDRTLKESGDAVLLERGISPSEVVRALWAKLAQRGQVADEALETLLGEDASGNDDEAAERVAVAVRGTQLYAEGCARLGISTGARGVLKTTTEGATWKDVREEAIAARLHERGVA